MSRKTAFGCVAYAFFAVMVGPAVPTPLFPIYEQRFGFGSLMVTVIFATYAASCRCSWGECSRACRLARLPAPPRPP